MATKNDYNKEYITFDELMAVVEDDMSSFTEMGHIESDKYIRVVEECNSFLSVKINPVRNKTVEVKNYRAKLPSDFKLWIRGTLCSSYREYAAPITTTTTTTTTTSTEDGCDTCIVCGQEETTCEHVTVTTEESTILVINEQTPLILTNNKYYCDECYETRTDSYQNVSISEEDGDLYLNTGFEEGPVILAYTAKMLSKDDILIYDHPMVRRYYEYAIKERILEDVWLNGKEDVYRRYQVMVEKLRQAKMDASRFVSTPDFADLHKLYMNKRKKYYYKYFAPLLYKA